ncbi:MAG TPA: Rrf2 family transcriptional regulator [Thermoanaerobaculaceae bacterium]|nr:Rrf2 family transcriptional regulator [Thermoanaerobaculaceae bacterium]HPS79941.1 Rrf2 family transcriptional regulator [Thermoanaerobaculaceae bacterium]
MRITATEELGMRLLLRLAQRHPRTVAVAELAGDEGLTEPFAAKVVGQLRRAGLVVASRGRSGGYVLAAAPDHVTVLQVFHALGEHLFDGGFCDRHRGEASRGCVRQEDCALRSVWSTLDAVVGDVLAGLTLADLVSGEAATARQLQLRWRSRVPITTFPIPKGVSP